MKNITLLLALCICALGFSQSEPTSVAPTPQARAAADVISIFSDAYTDVSGSNYNPNWGQSGFASANPNYDVLNSGDIALQYPNFNYQGNQFGSNQNVAAMEFIHIDVWTNNTNVNFFLIGLGGGNERSVTIPASPGVWTSMDIPLADYYAAGLSGTTIQQFKYDGGNGTATSEIYVDNIFFWRVPADPADDATLSALEVDSMPVVNFSSAGTAYTIDLVQGSTTVPQITLATTTNQGATAVINQATAIPGTATVDVTSANGNETETYTINFTANTPPASPNIGTPDNEALLIYADNTSITNAVVWDYPFGGTDGEPDLLEGTDVDQAIKMNFAAQGYGQGVQPADAFDTSAYNWLHFDYFADSQSTELQMILITPGAPNVEVMYQLNLDPNTANADGALVQGSWQSVDVPMSFYTAQGIIATSVFQYKLGTTSDLVSDIVYFDNIYFSVNQPVTLSEASFTAGSFKVYPNPTNDTWNVRSANAEISTIQLYDISGKQVMTVSSNALDTTIDGSSLDSGIYLARINSANATKTVKLIKM